MRRLQSDPERWERCKRLFTVREIPSRTTLLREGDVARSMYFVKTGCLRLWFNKDGRDVTFQFFFDGQAVSSLESFLLKEPSLFTLESVEPTSALVLTRQNWDRAYEIYPEMREQFVGVMVQRLGDYGRLFLSRIKDSPQERYEALLREQPETRPPRSPALHRVLPGHHPRLAESDPWSHGQKTQRDFLTKVNVAPAGASPSWVHERSSLEAPQPSPDRVRRTGLARVQGLLGLLPCLPSGCAGQGVGAVAQACRHPPWRGLRGLRSVHCRLRRRGPAIPSDGGVMKPASTARGLVNGWLLASGALSAFTGFFIQIHFHMHRTTGTVWGLAQPTWSLIHQIVSVRDAGIRRVAPVAESETPAGAAEASRGPVQGSEPHRRVLLRGRRDLAGRLDDLAALRGSGR